LLKVARDTFRLTFGVLALFLGLGIIGWVCYNEFIERLPQYGGFHWWEPFGMDRRSSLPAGIGFKVLPETRHR